MYPFGYFIPVFENICIASGAQCFKYGEDIPNSKISDWETWATDLADFLLNSSTKVLPSEILETVKYEMNGFHILHALLNEIHPNMIQYPILLCSELPYQLTTRQSLLSTKDTRQ